MEPEPLGAADLAALLTARERRWALRQQYAEIWPAVLSMTLCVPMPLRGGALAAEWFAVKSAQVLEELDRQGFALRVESKENSPDGPVLLAVSQRSAPNLKRACIWLEEHLSGGRLLDLDVTATGGRSLSRRELGVPPRKCFLCERPAVECASRGLHSRDETARFARVQMEADLPHRENNL